MRQTVADEISRLTEALETLNRKEDIHKANAVREAIFHLEELEEIGIRFLRKSESIVDVERHKALVNLERLIDEVTAALQVSYTIASSYEEIKARELLEDFSDMINDALTEAKLGSWGTKEVQLLTHTSAEYFYTLY